MRSVTVCNLSFVATSSTVIFNILLSFALGGSNALGQSIICPWLTVNPDAAIATREELNESTKQGILVSVLMNAMLYPVNRHNRKVAIKTVNSSTDAINAILENDAAKFVPLSEDATEEEIKQRQEEIKAFRSAYIDALEEEMVKSNPELANRTDSASVIDSADIVPTSATSSNNPIVANATEAAKKNFAQVKQAGQSRIFRSFEMLLIKNGT